MPVNDLKKTFRSLKMENYAHIRELANKDVDMLIEKGMSYGNSWRKRGGIGAFMMMARKMDGIENQSAGYDIFKSIQKGIELGITNDGILDAIRDLPAYLLLLESTMSQDIC